jgi:NADH-quinone oxidoreductase subunit H
MDFFSDPVSSIGNFLATFLASLGLPGPIASILLLALGAAIPAVLGLTLPLFTIWLERRLIGRMQDRIGPNRVGPFGLMQSLADVIKLLCKEDIMPTGADKIIFILAPILAVLSVLAQWAVIPFASKIYGVDLNVGVVYVIAVGSLGTLAVKMAGWASNNKYALLSAFRVVAQLVSYEVPLILSILVPVLLAHSLSLNDIVLAQPIWFVFTAPIAAMIFFIAAVAESSRAPFDLLEADSEIVAGFNLEYSAMKFGMFFVAEFTHAFTVAALMATFFLGGWRGPWAETYPLLGLAYFVAKSSAVYFIIILMRATLPRLRIDQMLGFCWKFLTPLALVALILTMVTEKLIPVHVDVWSHAGLHFLVNLCLLGSMLALDALVKWRTQKIPSAAKAGAQ